MSDEIDTSGIPKFIDKRKKFTWVVVSAMVVGTIVGSGIVKDSVQWTAAGGSYALLGVLFVWFAFLIVAISMSDNASMMPERGGVYAWARITFGRFWGVQVGWLYLIGYTCLSVILSWLAFSYTQQALVTFFPEGAALIAANLGSFLVPLFFIGVFTAVFGLGVKRTTQVIIGFFIVKVTMWLTIVGIGFLHFDQNMALNVTGSNPLEAILTVGSLSVFAMLGLDSCSVVTDDIHNPGRNISKGVIVGMILVLFLYLTTVMVIMGLVGQAGASDYIGGGITDLFLEKLSVPTPVLMVFIVISVLGTLCITMYLVIRLSGAMALKNDYYFNNQSQEIVRRANVAGGTYKVEMPRRALIIQVFIYALFFILIFIENYYGTYFVLHSVYYMGILSVLFILFVIALTNFRAHRLGIGKIRRQERKEFRYARGVFIPILGMVLTAFVFILSVYYMWTQPAFPLPGPDDSYAWVFWQWFGKLFPALMIIPGLLFWAIKVPKEEKEEARATKKSKRENKKESKREKKDRKKDQ